MEVVSERPWATVTREGGLFRKHCAPVQRYEVALTVALAARWPDRVPEVVDHGDDWLLLRDAGAPIDALEPTLPLYAEIQQGEAAFVDGHLANGVPDLRAHLLPARYEAFAERDPRLRPFTERFAELCDSLTRTPTVQHDDLTGWNVHAGPRIIDWGDTCIAHPFATMYVTLGWTAHFHGEETAARVRAAYLDAWDGHVGDELARVLPVAAFARVLQWQRIGVDEGVTRNLEAFLSLIASS